MFASSASAQQVENSDSGPTWSEQFQGSIVSTLGWVNRLDSSFGYRFNSHFSVAAGVPLYFVRPSSTAATTGTTTQSVNGVGNVYARVGLGFSNEAVNFQSSITATAPTGKKSEGLSTGHATFDWSNYFEHPSARVTPFGEIGFANAISDTLFFVRPYTTYGFVAHFAGGLRYQLARKIAVGASVYDIAPTGQQTVVSRVIKGNSASATIASGSMGATGTSNSHASNNASGNASGNMNSKPRVFQTAGYSTGTSSIDKDYGFSTFARFSPASTVSFSVGYTRSAEYALNTVFFGVETRLDSLLRR